MSNTIKVINMPVSSAVTSDSLLMIIQGGVNKRITLSTLLFGLNSTSHIKFNPALNSINFSVGAAGDANALLVNGSTANVGIGTNTPSSKLHVAGNIKSNGVVLQSSESLTYTAADEIGAVVKPISPLTAITSFGCEAGVNAQFSLSIGVDTQIKTIVLNTITNGNTATISCTGLEFNTITMNGVGDVVVLQYSSTLSKWVILSNIGSILSTS